MLTTEELKNLVNQIPDPDKNGTYADLDDGKVKQLESVAARLEQGGRDAVLQLIDLLVEPGKGDDVKARFALHLLAVRVTQPSHERAREDFSQTLATQVVGRRPAAVRVYLIEELQLAGTKSAAESLGKALLEPQLCDTAARALAVLGDAAIPPLLQSLPQLKDAARRTVISKLGILRAKPAASAFREALTDADTETRIAAAWGCARIADRAAVPALLKAADAATGWERINLTDAAMTLAEGLLAAGGKSEAAALYQHLAKTRTAPAEAHIRAAAERGLVTAS